MVRVSFPSKASMVLRKSAPIFANVEVTRPTSLSCDLGDEAGNNVHTGGCFTGGVVYEVTGNNPIANGGFFDGGGLFTGIIDLSTHGGGR